MLSWHVARTEPSRSLIAEQSIKDIGFEVFNPKVREEKNWSRGRTHETIKPLIGGYMFVRFDVSYEGWQKINTSRGVIGLMLGASEIPARIPENSLLPLMSMCVDGYVPKEKKEQFIFSVGDIVKVIDGPFSAFKGCVLEAGAEKIKVEVSLFGRLTSIEGNSKMFCPIAG